MRRCEGIGSACLTWKPKRPPPWHADPLAVSRLGQTRRAILDTPLAPRQAALTRGEGLAGPRSDPPPGDHHPAASDRLLSALTTIPAAGRPDDRASPSEGPGLLCRLRGGARRGAVRSARAWRSARIPASTSGATQTDLDPAARVHAHPLDPEPSCETSLLAVHHAHHRVNDSCRRSE